MKLKHIIPVFFCCLSFSLFAEKTVTAIPLGSENVLAEISADTSFNVCYTDTFWGINIFLKENDFEAKNVLEIFFSPSETGKPYYQFYGSVRDRTIRFYPHGKFDEVTYPPLRQWGISYDKTKEGYTVRIMIARSNFLYQFFVEKWKFNIVRQRNEKSAPEKWSGNLHKPEEWGYLLFPEPDAETKLAMEEKTALLLTEEIMSKTDRAAFDPDRYQNRSWQNWHNNAVARIRERDGLDFMELRSLLDLRRFLTGLPAGKKVKIPEDIAVGNAGGNTKSGRKIDFPPAQNMKVFYVTNLANYRAAKPDSDWKILLNGKEVAAGKVKELPLNIRIGTGAEIKAGDELEIVNASGALEICSCGIIPGKAFNVEKPGAKEATPKRDVDGAISSGYLHRVTGHLAGLRQAVIAKKAPQVFFVGDSITDGFRGQAWKKLEQFRPFNLGISGDWTQNVLWRLQNGPFDICKPELMVLMIGTNNHRYTVQEVADGIAEIVKYTRSASPDTKILLLGIFPRGDYYPVDGRHEKINAIIKTYADNDTVFYKDLSHLWIDENRKIRRDLLPDKLHPSAAGNDVWADAMIPVLEMLLEKKP